MTAQSHEIFTQVRSAVETANQNARWPAGWLPGDAPLDIVIDGEDDPYAQVRLFDREARVRFLDALAEHGNVRAAAALVGVSRETAYRARRRHADFNRLWDAALVHARARAEAELATRALDGVAVPVMLRGEHVGTYRKHDARYLLAHLARLDRRIEEQPEAVLRAERFDELLAAMAGHVAPVDFAEAANTGYGSVGDRYPDVPPTERDYVAHVKDRAPDVAYAAGFDTDGDDDDVPDLEAEEVMMEMAEKAARASWQEWREGGAILLDRVLDGKNAAAENAAQDSVTCVNTPVPMPGNDDPG